MFSRLGMGNIVVKPIALAELEFVHRLDEAVYGSHCYPQFVLRQLFDTQGQYLLGAFMDNKLVGFILGAQESGGETAWLLALTTNPDFRNAGIGTSLFRAMVDLFRQKGVRSLFLTVAEDNAPAIHLYRDKFMFEVVRTEPNYFGDGEPRLVMEYRFRRLGD